MNFIEFITNFNYFLRISFLTIFCIGCFVLFIISIVIFIYHLFKKNKESCDKKDV